MTTTDTQTIADFLLAQIAAAEAVARRIAAVGSCDPAYDPARVLAQCEAHRRIVELLTTLDERRAVVGVGVDRWLDGQWAVAHAAATALAAIWADHDDYREEWAL